MKADETTGGPSGLARLRAGPSQRRLTEKEVIHVGHPDDFNASEIDDVARFIDKEHYLHYPFNEDGSKNPYQYCYGLGYISRNETLWSAFVSGIYPNAGFWNEHFPLLIYKRGLAWVFRHAANIYRIVAFYQEDADKLLSEYIRFCHATKRTCILVALPTKKEKDAVCNWDWFSHNGFKDYGFTKAKEARIFALVLDFEPIELSPIEKARETVRERETQIRYVRKKLEWLET